MSSNQPKSTLFRGGENDKTPFKSSVFHSKVPSIQDVVTIELGHEVVNLPSMFQSKITTCHSTQRVNVPQH